MKSIVGDLQLVDLYIYVLDNGKGLFTSRKKMKFNEAWVVMGRTVGATGFNYLRRIPVIDAKTQPESHLTPDYQDG